MAGDGDGGAVEGEGAGDGVEGLAVVVGGLAALGLDAEAAVALEDRGEVGGEGEVVGEVRRRAAWRRRRARAVVRRPVIDQSSIQARKGARVTPAWPMPPRAKVSAKRWAVAEVAAAWAIQNLRALPAGALAAGSGGLAEEGPLGAVGGAVGAGEVGGDVPPFQAEGGVGAVVAGEGDVGGGGDLGEAVRRRWSRPA